jgi:hypothetical protein
MKREELRGKELVLDRPAMAFLICSIPVADISVAQVVGEPSGPGSFGFGS